MTLNKAISGTFGASITFGQQARTAGPSLWERSCPSSKPAQNFFIDNTLFLNTAINKAVKLILYHQGWNMS